MLSAKRNARAAERFFRKALNSTHNQKPNGKASRLRRVSHRRALDSPRVINVDKNATYPAAIDELKTNF